MKYVPFFLLISIQVFAQSKAEKMLISLENSRFEALIKKDYEALDQIFSDRLIYNHADGKMDTKTSFIEGLKNGSRTYKNIVLDTLQVRVFDQTAILNGDAIFFRINKKGEQTQQKLRYTCVYVRNRKKWQMVSWHSTDLTNKR
jgi:ketosteroid isomerase-like protein